MSESFTVAADSMKEVIQRLKDCQAQITTLTANNKTLAESNKQLTAALKALGGKVQDGGGTGGKAGEKRIPPSNPNLEPCTICGAPHAKPFANHCGELEKNKGRRPKDWQSRM